MEGGRRGWHTVALRGLVAAYGGGKESISLFAVYTKSCFFFALLHGIYGLNLSIVICIVTEPAVLTYYIH